MSKVYVSSWSKPNALAIKAQLLDAGHEVVSTWHDGEFKRTAERTESEMENTAVDNCDLIAGADILFLVVPEELMPGGIYVEAGMAICAGIPVVAVGTRRDGFRGNNMLYHSGVHQFQDVDRAVASVQDIDDDHWGDEPEDDPYVCTNVITTDNVAFSPVDCNDIPKGVMLGCGAATNEPCGCDGGTLWDDDDGISIRPGIDAPDGSETDLVDD